MSVVVDLDAARGLREVTACAGCGGQWFALRREGGEPVVCLNGDGRISGYAGTLVCDDCGRPLS